MKKFAAIVSEPVPMQQRVEEVLAHIRQDPKLIALATHYDGMKKGDHAQTAFNAQTLLGEQAVANAIAWMIFDNHMQTLPDMDVTSAASDRYGERPGKGNTQQYLRMTLSADVNAEVDFAGPENTARTTPYNSKYMEGLQRLCALVPQITKEFLAGQSLSRR